MRIIGVGTDIVDIERVRSMRALERGAEFVCTGGELLEMNMSHDPAQFFASRFALKEALIKALPASRGYHDVEVIKDGAKIQARLLHRDDTAYTAFISLAHEFKYALAYATVCA